MSDTQTETPSDEQTAGQGTGGKHRGQAAGSEENKVPAQGRHRRPTGD